MEMIVRGMLLVGWLTLTKALSSSTSQQRPQLIFPGGGIFFYWQAGVVTYLRERYDLSETGMTGASAGALTATLAATDVDFWEATDLALDLSRQAGVWDRPAGLQGVWGSIIEEWIDLLLPGDAVERAAAHNLTLLLSPVPGIFSKTRIDSFVDRRDLIDCNRASVHIPWFLDGGLTYQFREQEVIDGSFLASRKDYAPDHERPTLWVDQKIDPKHSDRALLDAVEALSPEGIYQLVKDGEAFAAVLEEKGELEMFPKLKVET